MIFQFHLLKSVLALLNEIWNNRMPELSAILEWLFECEDKDQAPTIKLRVDITEVCNRGIVLTSYICDECKSEDQAPIIKPRVDAL